MAKENMPRVVLVRLVQGRSIPYCFEGRMRRLRREDPPALMPYQVYKQYAWKLELVGEDYKKVSTAMHSAEVVKRLVEPEPTPDKLPLPKWELKVSPEEYIDLYGSRENPSPRMRERLALAKQLKDA